MADTLAPARPSAIRPARSAGRIALRTVGLAYVGVLVLVPLGIITWRALSPGMPAFWAAISSEQAVTAFRLTAEVAFASVLLGTTFGVALGILLTRYHFVGRRLLGVLADLPMAVSPIVAGLALVLVYGRNGWFGGPLEAAGISIIYAVPGMILATTFVSLPLVLREVVPVLQEIGTDQEQAARVLGAGGWHTFWRITVPTIRPALTYGVVLALARCVGEFGAVAVVSGNVSGTGQTQTTTLVIAERVQQMEPGAYQLAFVLIVTTVAALLVAANIRRKDELS
ncbi:sulfate ABC transporter permease subunit CysW [Cellulomonas chitinilytica]|uniref:Sulfate ABC transporter permease subunit CysW n=1 Tax=Cellulomonas chitinilytica TaxID=398759 RepID=A0A919P3N1_9CELL|nr:sulfate ABC transporter permease subunit [Cellulomonas chitinilytica]GIG22737.1 sulfate ABC transporter permease subunit CysW [Cellulomonas chitinilytica]